MRKHYIIKSTLTAAVFAAMVLPQFAAGKKTVVEPSFAWGVEPPLGDRREATIDTLFENYSQRFVPQEVSSAYAATGNYCAEGVNLIHFDRPAMSDYMFRDPIAHWLPSEQKAKFYNTRLPMTLLSYNFGGGKENTQDHLSAVFSANANKRVQVGAMLDYLYSKGCYDNQAAKDLTWGFSGSYMGERVEFQGYYFHYNLVNKENGGITDPLYITDPAEVQGGDNSINPKQIPTFLSAAHNRVRGGELYLNTRYKLGFYEEEQVNDSTIKRTLVPVTSFIWTLKYTFSRHRFISTNTEENQEFWDNTYFNPFQTSDLSNYWNLRNTVGVALLEGFNKYAKAGLTAFLTHEARHYKMGYLLPTENDGPFIPAGEEGSLLTADPYPGMRLSETENHMWVGARLAKRQGRILNYDVIGELGILGPAAGEVKVDGEVTTRIPLFGDTVAIRGFGRFYNTAAPWLMNHYRSNHFVWDNSFEKTRSFRAGGELSIPWTRTHLTVGVENIQNQLFFNEYALPEQYGGNVQVFMAHLRQDFKFGPVHWDNLVTYQTTSLERVIPLPKLAVFSNLYVTFKVATLFVQLGVNCDYFTRYKAIGYQPATMQFYNQRDFLVGNYPFMNAYINFKLSKTRFYVMMSHVNQGLTGDNYFSMPNYPMNPRRFQLGLSVDLTN